MVQGQGLLKGRPWPCLPTRAELKGGTRNTLRKPTPREGDLYRSLEAPCFADITLLVVSVFA